MEYDPKLHHRKSIRLRGYPYAKPGYYYVTFATKHLESVFGEVVAAEMRLNACGRIVEEEWLKSELMRKNIEMDAYVIMPNHIHGIIQIKEWPEGEGRSQIGRPQVARTGNQPRGPERGSIGAILAGFKSAVTRRVNEFRGTPDTELWHHNYYESVLRGQEDLHRIRKYIHDNPKNWKKDKFGR